MKWKQKAFVLPVLSGLHQSIHVVSCHWLECSFTICLQPSVALLCCFVLEGQASFSGIVTCTCTLISVIFALSNPTSTGFSRVWMWDTSAGTGLTAACMLTRRFDVILDLLSEQREAQGIWCHCAFRQLMSQNWILSFSYISQCS